MPGAAILTFLNPLLAFLAASSGGWFFFSEVVLARHPLWLQSAKETISQIMSVFQPKAYIAFSYQTQLSVGIWSDCGFECVFRLFAYIVLNASMFCLLFSMAWFHHTF